MEQEELNLEIFNYPYSTKNHKQKKILLPSEDKIISHSLKTARLWDYMFMSILYQTISDGKDASYFDVGANIGTNSILASDFFSYIYAFEIDQTNCNIFKKAMEINEIDYFQINQLAVTETSEGYSDFFKSPNNIGGHSIALQENNIKSELKIKNICLDDFDHNVDNCRFLHIDTQGHDFKILNGAYEFINRQKVLPIIEFEFAPYLLIKHNSNPEELFAFVNFYDYNIFINASNTLALISQATVAQFFADWSVSQLPSNWTFPPVGWVDLYLIPKQ